MFFRGVVRLAYEPSRDILQRNPSHDVLQQLDRLKRSSPDPQSAHKPPLWARVQTSHFH